MSAKNSINPISLNKMIGYECLNIRQCINYLFSKEIISKDLSEEIYKNLDKYERENKVFITKPFRRNDSIEKDLFVLMKSRIRAFNWITARDDWESYEDKSS